MDISAKITGISYNPFLCDNLKEYGFDCIKEALSNRTAFILNIDDRNKIAVSWWVSAKRTRSYPYARVYNTLGFTGKRVTIIPVFKDEGIDGDRDFLQWDTIPLMSLLGVYVIISYYIDARKNQKYENKITDQRFNVTMISNEIEKLMSYQSDALHWNSVQIEKVYELAEKAFLSYQLLSNVTGVKMHSEASAKKKICKLLKDKESFMTSSRLLAQQAQAREVITSQPKELIHDRKSRLTIKNYLGGYYYFTVDEANIAESCIYLIEAKHTSRGALPSIEDIKEGLIKMVLYTNLKDVRVGGQVYFPKAILKLSTANGFLSSNLTKRQKEIYDLLDKEAEFNGFKVIYI